MTLDPSQWRSASQYDYVETLDAPDLAWEWLRRNARYQSDFAEESAPPTFNAARASALGVAISRSIRDRTLSKRSSIGSQRSIRGRSF